MSYPVCPLIPSGKKVLVICEKPSMARDLAPVLGANKSGEGFFTFDGGYISWARGHLLEMVGPSSYDEGWKRWTWETLPMIPPDYNFLYEPRGDALGQLSILKKLYKQSDIIVNACDAGREGELIWWEILRYCGWGEGKSSIQVGEKPALRFWAQSNTSNGLREAWETMFSVSDRLGLAEGAYSRAEGDWLLGLNMTRAATLSFAPPLSNSPTSVLIGSASSPSSKQKNSSKNSSKTSPNTSRGFWSIGRVQTPILALVCERDESIEDFKPKTFYQVKAVFSCGDSGDSGDSVVSEVASTFEATVLVPSGIAPFTDNSGVTDDSFDSDGSVDSKESKDPRGVKEFKSFKTAADAQAVLDRILASRPELWAVSQKTKKSYENPPNLFSLTSLQKWANKHWGWEAKRTLDAAQAAYESDKSLTYPRTDACFLPKDSQSKMDGVYNTLISEYLRPLKYRVSLCVDSPNSSQRSNYIFDDSKLTDHYAIVPTGVIPRDLTSDAGQLWLAVVRRFMVAFSSPALVSTLTRRMTLGEDIAVVSGKSYEQLGWIELDNDLARLTGHEPKMPPGFLPKCAQSIPLLDARLHEGKTTPPKSFTEATLLSLMENIHTSFEDSEDDLKEALGAKGIGTPATRASIIELLIARDYLSRFKKGSTTYLTATGNGRTLISNLKSLKLDLLTQAKLTAEWEAKLSEMENSKNSKEGQRRFDFLNGICSIVDSCLETLKSNQAPTSQGAISASRGHLGATSAKELDIFCPFTGKPVTDYGNYWSIAQYPSVRLYKKVASREMAVTEYFDILRNNSPVFQGFVSSKGKSFNAKLNFDQASGKFNFEFDNSVPFAGEQTKHVCPNTGKAIVDQGKCWLFPNMEARFWKEVSGRKMKISEYIELVKSGSTAYFENFKSKAGKPFTAALVLENNKVKFQFPNSGQSDRSDKMGSSDSRVSSTHPSSGASLVRNMGMKGPGARSKRG